MLKYLFINNDIMCNIMENELCGIYGDFLLALSVTFKKYLIFLSLSPGILVLSYLISI